MLTFDWRILLPNILLFAAMCIWNFKGHKLNSKSYNHCHTHVTSSKQFHFIGVSIKTIQFPMSHPIAKTDARTKNLYKTVSTMQQYILEAKTLVLKCPILKDVKFTMPCRLSRGTAVVKFVEVLRHQKKW